MNELTILTAGTTVRVIRPLASEDSATFCRRMEAMVAVLARHCTDTIAVFVVQPSNQPACIVTQIAPLGERQVAA